MEVALDQTVLLVALKERDRLRRTDRLIVQHALHFDGELGAPQSVSLPIIRRSMSALALRVLSGRFGQLVAIELREQILVLTNS